MKWPEYEVKNMFVLPVAAARAHDIRWIRRSLPVRDGARDRRELGIFRCRQARRDTACPAAVAQELQAQNPRVDDARLAAETPPGVGGVSGFDCCCKTTGSMRRQQWESHGHHLEYRAGRSRSASVAAGSRNGPAWVRPTGAAGLPHRRTSASHHRRRDVPACPNGGRALRGRVAVLVSGCENR